MPSDGINKAHADAVLALLHTALDPVPIVIYDGQVPDPITPEDAAAHPWVLVYMWAKWPTDGTGNTLDGQSRTTEWWIETHSTGASTAAARSIAGQVRAALLNARPTVTGRTAGPIRFEDGNPPNRDEDLGFPVMDQVDLWKFVTTG